MIGLVPAHKIYLACGATDMRKGIDGLSVLVQEQLARDPHSGAVFVFRGKSDHLLNVLSYDGQGIWLKRLTFGQSSERIKLASLLPGDAETAPQIRGRISRPLAFPKFA